MKTQSSASRSAAAAVLLVWTAFVLALQIHWLRTDTRPPSWDESHHLRLSAQYTDEFLSGKWGRIFEEHYFNYPPLYHWTLAPVLKVMRGESDAAGALNCLYLLLLISSVFFTIKYLCDDDPNPWPPVIGAVIVSSYPFLFYIGHFPLLDLPLTAWTAFGVLCLARCNGFCDRPWSVLLGVAWACGSMTKWTYFSYMLFPTVWLGVKSFPREKRNILLFICTALVLLLPWYYPNYIFVIRRMLISSGSGAMEGDPSIFRPESWLWYARHFPIEMGWWGTVLACAGLVIAIRDRRWGVLVGCVLFPYMFWSLTRNKDLRYIMPILPSVAILSALVFRHVKTRWIVVCVMICGAQLGWSALAPMGSRGPSAAGHTFRLLGEYGAYPPVREDWRQKEILDRVLQLKNPERDWCILRTLSWEPFLSNLSLRYACVQYGWYGQIKPLNSDYSEKFAFTDFILDHTDGAMDRQSQDLIKNSKWFKKVFELETEWPMPPGAGKASLYKLAPQIVNGFSAEKLRRRLANTPLNPDLKLGKVRFDFVPDRGAQAETGLFDKISVRVDGAEFRGFPLGSLAAELEQIQLNLPLLDETGELQVLSMGRLTPHVKVDADKLRGFLMNQAGKYLTDAKIVLDNNRVKIDCMSRYGLSAGVTVGLELNREEGYIFQRIERIKIGWFRVPRFLYKHFADRRHSLLSGPGMPFDLNIRSLELQGNVLKIN